MWNFPDKSLIQEIIPWLFNQRVNNQPPFVSVEKVKSIFNLNENEYRNLFHWFFDMKIWEPIGQDRLEITDFIEVIENRFGVHTEHLDFHLLHNLSNEIETMELIQLSAFASASALANNINESIDKSDKIPPDAKNAVKDFIEENIQDIIENILELDVPELISDIWPIVVDIIKVVIGG